MDIYSRYKKTTNFIPWVGGKYKMLDFLKAYYPAPDTYTRFVDVFGGSGVVTMNYPYRDRHAMVYNDLNESLFNLYRIIRDPEQSLLLSDLIELTPYSRREKKYAWDNYKDTTFSDLERARMFCTVIGQGLFARENKSFGFDIGIPPIRKKRWCLLPSIVHAIHVVFKNLIIENSPYEKIFDIYDNPGTLFYLDPPYLPTPDIKTKADPSIYLHNFNYHDHTVLLERIKSLKGKVMISGIVNPLYDSELKDWKSANKLLRQSMNTFSVNKDFGGCGMREEKIWYNYGLESTDLFNQKISSEYHTGRIQ